MINAQEKKVTHMIVNPYRPGSFGVDEMIEDLIQDNYKVFCDYDLKKMEINIFIDPPIDQHKQIVNDEEGYNWIGTPNIR